MVNLKWKYAKWSEEEEKKLIEGIKRHEINYKEIANEIKTKT